MGGWAIPFEFFFVVLPYFVWVVTILAWLRTERLLTQLAVTFIVVFTLLNPLNMLGAITLVLGNLKNAALVLFLILPAKAFIFAQFFLCIPAFIFAVSRKSEVQSGGGK